MKLSYPIILTPVENGWFVVDVPDFAISTQGQNYDDALYMAQDAICACALSLLDNGYDIASPSPADPIHEENDIVTWLDVDLDEYRRLHELVVQPA